MFDRIKKAGRRIFYHSCGNIGPIFDELAGLGIDGFWHQVALYDAEAFAKKCKERRITVYIHPDRQRLIPLGTPKEIDRQIKTYADLYHKMGGGGILYVEMENDAPFENVEALVKAVHKYR